MPYYSTYYRKLFGKDSPSGRPLRLLRIKKPRRKPKHVRKKPLAKPVLVIKKKKPIKKAKPRKKKYKLRKAKIGLSKRRRGQLAMRSEDIYERQMIRRLVRQTGMTHMQVKHLVNLAKKSDYIDIETVIGSVSGESTDKTELYEFAQRKIRKTLKAEGKITKSAKEIEWEMEKYGAMYDDWLRRKAWH
jgi:hypothetical protein